MNRNDDPTRRADRNVMLGLFGGAAAVLLVGVPFALAPAFGELPARALGLAGGLAAASVVDQLDELAWIEDASADAGESTFVTTPVEEVLAVAAVGRPEAAEAPTPEAAPVQKAPSPKATKPATERRVVKLEKPQRRARKTGVDGSEPSRR